MKQASAPLIFVTGVGQTWSSLKTDPHHRWNLLPVDKEVMFYNYPKDGRRRLAGLAAKALRTALFGSDCIQKEELNRIFKDLFRWCIVDENGNLPEEVDVRIYGARSFEKLKNVSMTTGEYTDDEDESLLRRIYADIPCRALAGEYGLENIYCFNYSTFSDLYTNAEKLHTMIEQVLEDQKDKTGAKQVILVPMSMGATVVSAYLDKYYTDTGSIGENLVQKVISIVGAWDGSDGLADLFSCDGGSDWNEKFYDTYLREALDNDKLFKCLSPVKKEAVNKLLAKVIDSLLDSILLNTSAFMALIPKDRFPALSKILFTPEREACIPRYKHVHEEALRYYAAQCNLRKRMYGLHEHCGIGFYFLAGYNMPFGGTKSDFEFLKLLNSANKTNSDTVIQISSTVPGTKWVKCGEQLENAAEEPVCTAHNHRSPDNTVDAAFAWFPENCWYFEGQEHELGTNNTALKLAIDIALGEVQDITDPRFPQFNQSRDIREAEKYLRKAREKLQKGTLSDGKRKAIEEAAAQTQAMLDCTHNNREQDNKKVKQLKELLD